MNIVAIDECGRGAGYGPLAIGLTLVQYELPFNPKRNKKDNAEYQIREWARSVLGLPELKSLDSKKLTEKRRVKLFESFPLPYIVIFKEAEEVNRRGYGALNYIFRDMIQEGLEKLDIPVDFLLCDASILVPEGYPYINVIQGDLRYPSIGASSVACKVLRDELIKVMAEDEDPRYDLANNKGYLTKNHKQALTELGMTKQHRISFCKNFTTQFNITNV